MKSKKTKKPDEPPRTAWLVVQEGGSSTEFYPCFYDTEEQANGAVDNHAAHTYNAFGPWEVDPVLAALPDEVLCKLGDLIDQVCTDVSMHTYAEPNTAEVERIEAEIESADER